MKSTPEIIVYITSNREKIITGNPLCLYIPDEEERKSVISDIARGLRANVIQLHNGDYILVTNT